MNLLYMKLRGFRKYKEPFEIKFDKETYIIGGNAKGKSTIVYAIVWAFLGTDLRGNDKISMINRESDDCYVEIGFVGNDNNEHILIRYKHTRYARNNFISLDGKNIKQKDLEFIYKDKPLFLSIFNPDYFKDAEPNKQKELIDKYLPKIPFDVIVNKLEASEKEKIDISDGNIIEYIKDINNRIKDIDETIKIKVGEKEYANKIAKQIQEEEKIFCKQEEIEALEQEKNFLELESKQKMKESLEMQFSKKEAEAMNFQNKLDKVNDKGRKVRIEYDKILSDPLSICPCCNQPMNVDAKKKAADKKRQELMDLSNEKKEYEDKVSTLKVEAVSLKMKLYGLGKADYSVRIKEINDRLAILKEEKNNIIDFNKALEIKRNSIENTRKDILKIMEVIEDLEKQKEKCQLQISIAKKLYCMAIQEKMKIAEKYLKNTKIQFYELIKSTGEIKDCFKITQNGEEFSSLSKSQKFVTIFEICNMLNKISELNIPLVVDDSESYPDYSFKTEDYQSQLIIIKAKRNRQLKISHKDERIIQPKTMKIRQNVKIQELKEVA